MKSAIQLCTGWYSNIGSFLGTDQIEVIIKIEFNITLRNKDMQFTLM